MSKADVVIVGGAAMGSSIAYHLTADPGFSGKVTVVERDPTYATASSSLSASLSSKMLKPIVASSCA